MRHGRWFLGTPLIVLGFLGYGLAGYIGAMAPTVTQEIVAVLVATNATLFLVGGVIVSAIESRREAPAAAPSPDEYAAWADRVLKSKA